MTMFLNQVDQILLQLLQLQGIPRCRRLHLNKGECPDGSPLDTWWAVGLQKDGVNILHQQRLEMVGKRRVVTVGCH